MTVIEQKTDRLMDLLRSYESCAVAFSAGVDSTVLAKAAYLALGDQAVAVTGVSPSLAERELEQSKKLADLIGIRHELIDTEELANEDYLRNAPDRCYHCKSELYTQIGSIAPKLGVAVIVNGANSDDLGDYRPGLQAGVEQRVQSPLAECGFTKDEVRQLAVQWKLPIWDKPAAPCLASRVAYGEEVTAERLLMIERAEQHLRDMGLRDVRVRYHKGDLARVEVPLEELPRILDEAVRNSLVQRLREIGFRFVTIDLEGFRSGSLNTLVPAETLTRVVQQARI